MSLLTVIRNGKKQTVEVPDGVTLSSALRENGFYHPHPCGGKGTCGKCSVEVNGEIVLSCQKLLLGDTTVILPDTEEALASSSSVTVPRGELCLCLDIGSTTLAMAAVAGGEVIATLVSENPQRAFGADVISRIEYCMKNGTHELRAAVTSAVNELSQKLLESVGMAYSEVMYVSGNTTMLHIFAGVDPSPMGRAPYTPEFLGEVRTAGESLGLERVGEAVLLPGIAAFVGADIVSGIGYVGLPEGGGYRLLIDLGTNAEIALFSKERILCTAAAAGPCFEGANISCGMSASRGAVYAVDEDGRCSVIGGGEAVGICGTGLIDAIAYGVKSELIDEGGYMEDGELQLCGAVTLTGRDVRELQLAKSAIRAAVECLLTREGITYSEIEGVYVAGGFSASLNVENAAYIGLISEEVTKKLHGIGNSSLMGAVKYATSCKDSFPDLRNAQYVDLSADSRFSRLFMEYMYF
ncbi:MAG: DUF4445 domain-containing protein [Clostridia bacterium]|nr:DUF4445 domain-containing protein [Clostridia bacterium]